MSKTVQDIDIMTGEWINAREWVRPEYADLINTHEGIVVNSVGEGQINVVPRLNDDGTYDMAIEAGDLIVTSHVIGKGMKQHDDIVRNSTVAKARETVTFTSPDEVKQIACIYLCG
jgi:hypothetical protein